MHVQEHAEAGFLKVLLAYGVHIGLLQPDVPTH